MSYHNSPLHVPNMAFWNMQNEIMCRFFNQYVTMVDMFFIQPNQYYGMDMDMDANSHPVSNGDTQDDHYEKETDIAKNECNRKNEMSPKHPEYNDE